MEDFLIEKDDFDLLDLAIEEYLKFRGTEEHSEEYKYRILEKLNNELNIKDINPNSILGIITTLQKNNPQEGSFVHWSNLDDLKKFADDNPEIVSELFKDLFDESKNISERISKFREEGKIYNKDISLGTPLFGYILTAFDRAKYTIYKDSSFQEFGKWFSKIEIPTGIGEKYEFYLNICKLLKDYFRDKGYFEKPVLLDAQDLIFSATDYDSLRFKIYLKYLYGVISKLHHYKENMDEFIKEIKNLDREYLEKKREEFKGKKKLQKIWYLILNRILEGEKEFNEQELNQIKNKVNKEYAEDILSFYNNFKILFRLYYDRYYNHRESYFISQIYNILKKSVKENSKTEVIISDYKWRNNLVTDFCWLPLYPKETIAFKDSTLLHLLLEFDKITFGLRVGENLKDKIDYADDYDVEKNIDNVTLDRIVNKFLNVVDKYNEINFGSVNYMDEKREVLHLWKKVLEEQNSGVHFMTKERYNRLKGTLKLTQSFVNKPSKEIFISFWDKLDAAQRTSTSENVLKGNSIKKLGKVIKEMIDSNEYKISWEREIKNARNTLWELFGLLHIEEVPLLNYCSVTGLRFFEYRPKDRYDDVLNKFEEFKNQVYLKEIGYVTKGKKNEIPLNLEIDQLFNVIDKVKERDIEKAKSSLEEEIYRKILHLKKQVKPEVNYWKIAPGENAWNWDACKGGGFIAIGWHELGDISNLSRSEFNNRRDKLVKKFPDWTKAGTDQVWTFVNHIKEGDRIIANKGTSEVLGIGKVTGNYYIVPGIKHGHRLPVDWYDLTPRMIDEYGWRRTLVKLDKNKFNEIINALPLKLEVSGISMELHPDNPFTTMTFELLENLHNNPTRDFYLEYKDEFKQHLEEPFQELLHQVANKLPSTITTYMETESRVFSKIPKNDFGRGGAWDFYWGAFYPKGGKRIEDAQLFVWMNHERLDFGFYIGEYGKEQRVRFLRNCKENQETLNNILKDSLSVDSLRFGKRDDFIGGLPEGTSRKEQISWNEWLKNIDKEEIRVAISLNRNEILQSSTEDIIDQIKQTFERLFPLVILANSEDPLPEVGEYLEIEEEPGLNPEYTLAHIADETGFDEEQIDHWVRAIERKKQAILYGPPGTGKTFLAEKLAKHLIGGGDGFMDIVQFHPDYAYEDFMQGIRPKRIAEGQLDYLLVPGRFLEFAKKARTCNDTCVLIVDEINRANLARVFGELMYLLEYRDREIPLASGGKFRIPTNIRIIGTMNTADRSIALVDHALRRRFAFIALYPQYDVLRRYHEATGFSVEGLIDALKQLNNQIGDKHYHVGITYFLRDDLSDQIEDIWRMEVEPYLEEFFFDQPDKVDQFRWKQVKDKIFK